MLYGLYTWLWLNPSLYLIRGYREFFTDNYFFMELAGFPGGVAEYVSRLFIQFYNYPSIAALLVFLCLATIYLSHVKVFDNKKFGWLISFLPVFILLLMRNDYGHAALFDVNVLFLSVFLFLFNASLKRGWIVISFAYILLLVILLYLSGFFTAFTFVVVSLLMYAQKKGKRTGLSVMLAGTLAVLLLFYALFSISYHDFVQEYTDITRIYSFRYYPLVLFASIIAMSCLNSFSASSPEVSRKAIGIRLLIIPSVLLLLFLLSDKEERQSLQVQHFARNGEWEKTLLAAQGCELPDKNMAYYTNEALYHTGRIYDELFSYNQSFGSDGLMLAEMGTFSEIVPNQEIFMQLGALSLSIIWGTEAVNVYGANPYVLHNLTKAYLAGGYVREAQKILNLLDRTLFQKEWVNKYRAIANDTALVRWNPELSRLQKSQTPLAVVSKQSPLTNLYLLSKETNLNKMAYNYLMIGAMLDHQIENFVYCASRLKEYGYTRIPKLYMEGLIYSALFSSSLPAEIAELEYDNSILARFAAFRSELPMLQQNPHEAKEILKRKYGDTYWYYLIFDSPLNDNERVNIVMNMMPQTIKR